jgi:hypothetical protein
MSPPYRAMVFAFWWNGYEQLATDLEERVMKTSQKMRAVNGRVA